MQSESSRQAPAADDSVEQTSRHVAGSEGGSNQSETRSSNPSREGAALPFSPVSPALASSPFLASLLECPVCFDYALPPMIQQCKNGHIVCSSCLQNISWCPICRGPIGNIRNLAMEAVAKAICFPCRHSHSGCSALLSHLDKTEHEEACEFRPYSCPCPGGSCQWQGSLLEVVAHLAQSHTSITTLHGEDIVFRATDVNMSGPVEWVMMQSCFGHHFILVLQKHEKYEGCWHFFAAVLLIGSRSQANNFVYRLELNGHKRRLTWEATPHSIREGAQAVITSSDSLVIDAATAHLFAEQNNLGITVTISLA